MNLDSKNITIFTDGSSRGNPGPGGWGVVIVYNDDKLKVKEFGGREAHTTNNRMEMRAAIEALSFIKNQGSTLNPKKGRTLVLYTDSSYLVNGITKWIYGWQKNGWRTKTKEPVENQDLWEKLLELITIYRNKIEWKLVGGHIGVVGNERCDKIAQMFADSTQINADKIRLYDVPIENYPLKNILEVFALNGQTSGAERGLTYHKQKSRSRAKAYSYISMIDGIIKIHKTWAECEARVKGKPAKFKKILSQEEEKETINLWSK